MNIKSSTFLNYIDNDESNEEKATSSRIKTEEWFEWEAETEELFEVVLFPEATQESVSKLSN